jgi:hypothetical protein
MSGWREGPAVLNASDNEIERPRDDAVCGRRAMPELNRGRILGNNDSRLRAARENSLPDRIEGKSHDFSLAILMQKKTEMARISAI